MLKCENLTLSRIYIISHIFMNYQTLYRYLSNC